MMLYQPEETELAIRTSASRMLLVGTAQIAAKTTRDSQGVAVVTLKKNQTIASVVPADTLELANPHRYRVRSLPATGALIRTEDEGGERWVLVDWKSGSRPKMSTMQSRRFQLGLYRIAFSRIMGVDPERISTVFVYLGGKGVAEVWDHQIRGGLPSEAQLAKVIREARKG